MTFEDCICIAQARVIAGRKKEPHICTIAFHEPTERFMRFCLPFDKHRPVAVKRWTRFAFQGDKDDLGNDNRHETWHYGSVARMMSSVSKREKDSLHVKILSQYRYEHELHESRSSIGILIPESSIRFCQEHLNPRDPEDKKEITRHRLMEQQGIWYPDFKVFVKGYRMVDGQRKSFNKSVVAWDIYEAIRTGRANPFQAIYSYRNPYLVIGNLVTQRNAFIVIGVLSAPDGLIERCAVTQQLSFI